MIGLFLLSLSIKIYDIIFLLIIFFYFHLYINLTWSVCIVSYFLVVSGKSR